MSSRLVVTICLVLLVTGCAATAPAEPSPASSPQETSTPTPAQAALPLPTVPLACSDLFSAQQASDLLGTPVTVKVDESTVRNIADAAGLQAGMLSCIWGGENKTDNSWEQAIIVNVLPNAEADFDRGVWQVDDGAIVYPDGELSEYLCNSTGFYACFANVLLDGYWVQVQAGSATVVDAQMRTIVDTVRSAITSAGPARPAWLAPDGVLSGALCAPADQGSGAERSADFVATARVGLVNCQPDGDTWITILPGGAWAMPGFDAYADRPYWSVNPLEPIAVTGTDQALGSTTVDGGYYAIVAVDGSAVALSRFDVTPEQFLAEAPALIAEIVAAG